MPAVPEGGGAAGVLTPVETVEAGKQELWLPVVRFEEGVVIVDTASWWQGLSHLFP
jgi:hypothetical protein